MDGLDTDVENGGGDRGPSVPEMRGPGRGSSRTVVERVVQVEDAEQRSIPLCVSVSVCTPLDPVVLRTSWHGTVMSSSLPTVPETRTATMIALW